MANRTVTFDVLALARAQGFDEAQRQIHKLSDGGTKDLKLLSTAIVGLSPALVPVGAAAAAAGVGLAGLGAAGVLAFKGIGREMRSGSLTGQAFTAQISELQNNVHTLEATAARGVLVPFQQSVARLQPLMPSLNADVAVLSGQLGTIAGNTGVGVVGLFHSLNPLLTAFGSDLADASGKFADWGTSSTSVSKFVDYAIAELPKVEATVANLAVAGGHVVQGFAPLGSTTLTALQLFSKAASAVPVGVLQAITPALVGLKVGGTVDAALTNLGAKLSGASGFASKLGPLVSGLGPAAQIAAPFVLTLASAFGSDSEKTAAAAAQTRGFTDALKASHGALNQNIRDLIATDLQQSGALDSARKLGLNLSDLTDAALGNAGALKRISDRGQELGLNLTKTGQVIVKAGSYTSGTADATRGLAADYGKVIGAVGGQSSALRNAIQDYKNTTAAASTAGGRVKNLAAAVLSVPGYRTSKLQVDSAQALAKITTFNDRLNDLNGKTVYTYVLNTVETINKRAAGSAGTNLATRATGGPVSALTPYLVGERGPEIFMPTAPGRIIPNSGGGAAHGGVTYSYGDVHVHVAGTVIAERDLGYVVAQALDRLPGARGSVVKAIATAGRR